ncbi:MAG: prepilin-type N-terminal cleavage/methylation domain-containing protein [Rickettsiales bacterium]|nr:prepilin-type N-terminal cleavage/methylation domain-containing protein [Rickettsiales bacterium]
MNKYKRENGFTLLELIITLAIIATVTVFAIPNLENTKIKREFRGYYELLNQLIVTARITAIGQGNTARLLVERDNDEYTMTVLLYAGPDPIGPCNDTGTWTQIDQQIITLNTRFEITGNRVGTNLCFFRDNSSNGGGYVIEQKDDGTDFGISNINIAQATGYINATIQTGQ